MDLQLKYFSTKTIGYALAISIILCLALPCLAIVSYLLLLLLSFIVGYVRVVLEFCFYGPIRLAFFLIVDIYYFLASIMGCWCWILIIVLLRILLEAIPSMLESLSDDSPKTYSVLSFLFCVWIFLGFILLVCSIFGFTDDAALSYSKTLMSYARYSSSALIGIFTTYRVYIFSWAPVVVVLAPTILEVSFVFLALSFKYIAIGIAWLFGASSIGIYKFGFTSLLGIIIVLDWLFSKRRFRFICPTENCGYIGKKSPLYRCPHCGEIVPNLKPSYEGIFYKKCPNCEKTISVSCLTGRDNYDRACPRCHHTWEYYNLGNMPVSVYVIEGAARSGKTSFLVEMLIQWSLHFPKDVKFSMESQKRNVKLLGNSINAGNFCPPSKRFSPPEAYVMQCKRLFRSMLTYFYDANDRSSSSFEAGMTEPYFNMAKGIFLVIDPWAESCVLSAFGEKLESLPRNYHYSTQNADAVIGRLCNKLEHLYTKSGNSKFNIPLCIIVTKCDINGLNKKMGVDSDFSPSSDDWNKNSKLVENYLNNIGMNNFISIIRTHFKKYAFFAINLVDDSRRNYSVVLNPLLWMRSKAK